jgi:hypothetical protein
VHDTVIWLRAEAPQKPAAGMPCNGCGVCCASEPCPVAIVFLRQRRGSCRALEWDAATHIYRCGMLLRPAHYLPLLPRMAHNVTRRLMRRWIAADTVCDASDDCFSA